jgi:hypothetical protein
MVFYFLLENIRLVSPCNPFSVINTAIMRYLSHNAKVLYQHRRLGLLSLFCLWTPDSFSPLRLSGKSSPQYIAFFHYTSLFFIVPFEFLSSNTQLQVFNTSQQAYQQALFILPSLRRLIHYISCSVCFRGMAFLFRQYSMAFLANWFFSAYYPLTRYAHSQTVFWGTPYT